jgi:1-acyl-sn-glycerol-3-phosphate acyltransferase
MSRSQDNERGREQKTATSDQYRAPQHGTTSKHGAAQGTAPLGSLPAGKPAVGFVDGAAIRAHTGNILHQDDMPDEASTNEPVGKSIDRPTRKKRSTQLMRVKRMLPASVARRLQKNLTATATGRALARLEPFAQASTYREMVRQWQMRSRSDRVDPYGLDPVFAERWRPLMAYLYRNYWHVETSGVRHIPDHGRAIVVANHGGYLPYDCLMLMYAIRYDHPAHRTARPLVENSVFYMPFVGPALNRLGGVRACQENAERLLSEEQVTIAFPEGDKGSNKPYRERYQLQRFGRGGFVKLALRTKAPIIPAAVLGAEEASPLLTKIKLGSSLPSLPITPTFPLLGPLGLLPLPSRWYIRFAPPIDLGEHGPEAVADGVLVQRVNEQARTQVQKMLDELRSLRDEKSGK